MSCTRWAAQRSLGSAHSTWRPQWLHQCRPGPGPCSGHCAAPAMYRGPKHWQKLSLNPHISARLLPQVTRCFQHTRMWHEWPQVLQCLLRDRDLCGGTDVQGISMSNHFCHPPKTFFSWVYKPTAVHLRKICNYGQFQCKLKNVQILSRSPQS